MNSFTVAEHLDVSGGALLMERCLQNPGTSFVHIDVGQHCCVHDYVFMIILIEGNLRNKFVHRRVVQ